MIFEDGSKYHGEWFENKQHGEGTKTNKNNVSRAGEWIMGKRTKWTGEVTSNDIESNNFAGQ